MKTIILSIGLSLSLHSFAQDGTFYFKNGTSVSKRISSISENQITFTDASFINLSRIDSIDFSISKPDDKKTHDKLLLHGIQVRVLGQLQVTPKDVRKSNWGDSMEKVKQSEPQNFTDRATSSGVNYTYFMGTVGGLEALIAFYFIEDKLFKVRYIFSVKHSNEQLFLDDFSTVKEILDDKYGKVETEKYWKRDLYKDDYDKYGFAISLGDLSWFAEWNNDRTIIVQGLSGENYSITHEVSYTSKELKEKAEAKRKEKSKSDF